MENPTTLDEDIQEIASICGANVERSGEYRDGQVRIFHLFFPSSLSLGDVAQLKRKCRGRFKGRYVAIRAEIPGDFSGSAFRLTLLTQSADPALQSISSDSGTIKVQL